MYMSKKEHHLHHLEEVQDPSECILKSWVTEGKAQTEPKHCARSSLSEKEMEHYTIIFLHYLLLLLKPPSLSSHPFCDLLFPERYHVIKRGSIPVSLHQNNIYPFI